MASHCDSRIAGQVQLKREKDGVTLFFFLFSLSLLTYKCSFFCIGKVQHYTGTFVCYLHHLLASFKPFTIFQTRTTQHSTVLVALLGDIHASISRSFCHSHFLKVCNRFSGTRLVNAATNQMKSIEDEILPV